MISISICLTDLPKGKITEGKNGKKYMELIVDKRKEVDQYGKTHTVYVSQTKDERDAKTPKAYVGNGKEFIFNQQPEQPYAGELPKEESDDLPFSVGSR